MAGSWGERRGGGGSTRFLEASLLDMIDEPIGKWRSNHPPTLPASLEVGGGGKEGPNPGSMWGYSSQSPRLQEAVGSKQTLGVGVRFWVSDADSETMKTRMSTEGRASVLQWPTQL